MANTKKYLVAGVGAAIVIAIGLSFTLYLGQFEGDNVIQFSNQEPTEGMTTIRSSFLGSESAQITIIEVGDYQCEMCKEWYEHTRPKIIENYVANGKAQLTFLDMPFLGMDSITASMASYCAQDQDKYWDYHVALYEHQEGIDSGWASNERLKVFAFTLDLNMDQFSLCLDSNRYYQEVKQNFNKAKNLGVQSTPTFFILNTSGDQEIIRGAQPYSVFEQVIESLL